MKSFRPFPGVTGAFEGKKTSEDFNLLRDLVLMKQVHGDLIHVIKADSTSQAPQEADAILSFNVNFPIAVRTADCVPILLAHPDGMIAAVHAGWRGTRLKILEKTLMKIRDEFKKDLTQIFISIGPAICASCYEVGEEVAAEFSADYLISKGSGKYLLDLKKANFDLAVKMGLKSEQIQVLPDCTLCQNDEYYSYRHETQQGLSKEGRNYSWVKMY